MDFVTGYNFAHKSNIVNVSVGPYVMLCISTDILILILLLKSHIKRA